jgi:putative hemolysin
VLVVVVIAFATLVIGELVPKYLAITRPEAMALRVARPINWLSKIGYPIVVLLTSVSRMITRLLGVHPIDHSLPVSDQEIRHLVLEGRLHGSIHPTEHHLIHQVLDFSDTMSRQVMTPRPDIAAIDINDDIAATLRMIREEGYSRYPVFEHTVDKIRGVVYTKDIIHLMTEDSPIILADLIRPVVFVPDSMPIVKVLARFQTEHRHLAIVLDEFGGTAGLLTMEDILEEIVGEIQDEYDAEPSDFQQLPDGSALVSGGLSIVDFNERFGANLPAARADTMAGLMSVALDRIPHRGDHLELEGIRLEVASREGRRVRLLRVRKMDTSGDL